MQLSSQAFSIWQSEFGSQGFCFPFTLQIDLVCGIVTFDLLYHSCMQWPVNVKLCLHLAKVDGELLITHVLAPLIAIDAWWHIKLFFFKHKSLLNDSENILELIWKFSTYWGKWLCNIIWRKSLKVSLY